MRDVGQTVQTEKNVNKAIQFDRYSRLRRQFGVLLTLLALFSLASIFIMPLYWMFTGSFKFQKVTMDVPPEFFPAHPTLGNWQKLFFGPWPIWNWLLNSIIVSLLTVVIVLLVSSITGYSFGKKKFPGSGFLFFIILSTMFLPNQVMLIPLFLLVRTFHLTDTTIGVYLAMALPMLASPFGIFLIKQYCSTIPDELIDAARIDGASEWNIYYKIMLPLLMPAMAALAIFTFSNAWNNFMWQLVIAADKFQYTLPVGVSYIARTSAYGREMIDIGLTMAGGSFGAFFMIVFFLAFQKYFVEGITFGAVKG
jgi:multiple sugar transport system permease protein